MAILGGLVMTSIYGSFQHYRYWEGTNIKVQKTEIELSLALLRLTETNSGPNKSFRAKDLEMAFKPLYAKIPISVYDNDELVFSNIIDSFTLKEINYSEKRFNNLRIVFGIYKGPTWIGKDGQFWKWLSTPSKWISSKFDFIGVPFLAFSSLIYFMVFSLAWKSRAHYFSKKVLATLEKMEKRKLGIKNET
jgi:hypothetical protein